MNDPVRLTAIHAANAIQQQGRSLSGLFHRLHTKGVSKPGSNNNNNNNKQGPKQQAGNKLVQKNKNKLGNAAKNNSTKARDQKLQAKRAAATGVNVGGGTSTGKKNKNKNKKPNNNGGNTKPDAVRVNSKGEKMGKKAKKANKGKKEPSKPLSSADLDSQLESYKFKANPKEALDAQLESYQKSSTPAE